MLKFFIRSFIFLLCVFSKTLYADCFNWAIISDPGGPGICAIELNTNIVTLINLPTVDKNGAPLAASFPLGVAISPDGTRAYTANNGNGGPIFGTVSVFDLTVNPPAPLFNIPLTMPSNAPRDIKINGQFAYVLNSSSENISIIDLTTSTVSATTFTGGSGANFMALKPTLTDLFAYVTNTLSKNVSVVNLTTNSFTTIPQMIAGNPIPSGIAIEPNKTFAYVANVLSNKVSVIDVMTNTFMMNIDLPGASQSVGVSFTPDGSRAYIVNAATTNVSVIDVASHTFLFNIPLPGATSPQGIAITSNGEYAYIPSAGGSHEVSVIEDLLEPMPMTLINIPTGAGSLAFIDTYKCPLIPLPQTTGPVQGTAKSNGYALQTDIFNTISWSAPSAFPTEFYLIYQNGKLIGQVPAGTFTFEDHYLKPRKVYTYLVVALDSGGGTFEVGTTSIQTKKN